MSIKTRLLLSYIAMTFIPVVFFALIMALLASVFFNDTPGRGEGKRTPAFWQSFNQRDELFAGVKFMAQTDPDRFTDTGFLKSTDERLNDLGAGLVVVKNGRMPFISAIVKDNANSTDLYNQLQRLPEARSHRVWGPKIAGRFSAEKVDLTFGDRSSGTVYLLSDMSGMMNGARTFFPILLLSFLAAIGLTNGVLTYLVSRSIIKPLNVLKHAAEQIREGNLDHRVRLKRKDEIGELGGAFEEMRNRLDQSIRLQLQYEENRKELISNISHDLKTPITGIKASVEAMLEGIPDTGPKREKYLGMIAKKAQDMDKLIDELFLFSKLDLKRLPFHLENIDVAAYLRDCVDELRIDPQMEGMSIAFAYAGDRPVYVRADREKLRRVIMNIVENSIKYMDKDHKKLMIELHVGKGEATIKITDNGMGIESAALPHIFDRFYRQEPSRNTATGGSGLGLAIVKQIVEGHGGAVWAESRIGEGTSIFFTLPVTAASGGERS